jgi:transcriptional regulator with XRE-family HTH domain
MPKMASLRTVPHRGRLSQYVYHLTVEKGLTPTDIERRTAGQTSYSLIAGIAAGDFNNVRWQTLRALARGLGVAAERLFAVAIGAASEEYRESDFLTLYYKYLELTADHRSAIDSLLRLLRREIERLRAQQERDGQSPSTTEPGTQNGKPKFDTSENLTQYVTRLMEEKHLSMQDVAERSQQQISKAYLCDLLHRRTANPTITKITALAAGLGVPPEEIFAVLEGEARAEKRNFENSIFAMLFEQYKKLTAENKRELGLLLNILDCEIDKRQMQQLRDESNRELLR